MRIVRNIGHVKRRKRIARWSAVGGFLILGSTFALAFVPEFLLVAYALLFGGFVLFNFGMQQVGKWSRSPRNDQLLDARLASLSDKYTLIHYARLGKRVVEHLLVHPGGVLVLTARETPGLIQARGNRWRKRGGGLMRLFAFSGPQLGNPALETTQAIAAVGAYLAEHQLEVDVSGAIVFVSPYAELDVEEPEYPTLKLEELPTFVRSLEPDVSIGADDREALLALLGQGEELETTGAARTRRPVKVKRRAA